jgi:SAM-dependent methyltransferase
MTEFDRTLGQRVFGRDPASYDRARPDYPAGVFDILQRRCGLKAGTRTFEIGPGTGKATRHLLRLGATPLVAVEPNERLAQFLSSTIEPSDGQLEVQVATLEEARLRDNWFDLGVAATVFHWLDQAAALHKVSQALRPGGWWAMWWNVYRDPARHDPFHEATADFLAELESEETKFAHHVTFALDLDARIADLKGKGEFDDVSAESIRWTAEFGTDQLTALYGSFSLIARLDEAERAQALETLARIADTQFGGRVQRPIVTPIFTGRRKYAIR